jgi:hypothetical protein
MMFSEKQKMKAKDKAFEKRSAGGRK